MAEDYKTLLRRSTLFCIVLTGILRVSILAGNGMNINSSIEAVSVQPANLDFQKVMITLRKYKIAILLLAAIITLLVFLAISTITPIYRASATLLINSSEKTRVVSVEDLISSEHTSENFQTQIEVLRSRQLAQRVVDEMALTSHWDFNPHIDVPPEYRNDTALQQFLASLFNGFGTAKASSEVTPTQLSLQSTTKYAVGQLLSKVDIVPVKDTKLVRVKVHGADPDLAARIANQYGESYINDIINSKVEVTGKASEWLEDRLEGIKDTLERSEAKLVRFREDNGLVNLGGRIGGLKEQQISVLAERRVDAQREMRELKILLDEIDREIHSSNSSVGSEVSFSVVGEETRRSPDFKEYESLSVINSNTLVQRLRFVILQEEGKLDELRIRYGEKHPLVVSAQSNLDAAMNNLNFEMQRIIDSVRKQHELAEASFRSLDAQLRREERETYNQDRREIEMNQLQREVEANQNLYNNFFKRAKEANSEAEGISAVIASISDPATIPSNPVFPRSQLTLGVAFILSLLGFSFLAVLIEKFRNTVQDVDTVVSKLGLPMMGLVPLIRSKKHIKTSRAPVAPGRYIDKDGLFDESFKTIRSSFYLSSSVDDKLVMVTSTLPSEGKSTVALNLAHSMSLLEKVLLVEADMRRPTLHLHSKRKFNGGLSDHLLYNDDLSDCIVRFSPGTGASRPQRHGTRSNFDILPAGHKPEMPLELLTSLKFETMLSKLVTMYDRIIIDTAPVGAVSDALMVGRLVDTTVFVTGADSTQIQDIGVSLDRLQNANIKVAGVVISKVDIKNTSRYGGGNGYRGYFDTYGYGTTT